MLGGSGGRLARADVRLIQRAVRERWEIPDVMRRQLPLLLFSIASDIDPKTKQSLGVKPRDRVAAARTLVAMQADNNRGTEPVSEIDPDPEPAVERLRTRLLAALDHRGDE